MRAERYTEAQVLCGIREAWHDFIGTVDPFDADTQIYTYMTADGTWFELDFVEVFRTLERCFGFTCSDEEWGAFFGFDVAKRSAEEWEQIVVPNLTFGALARFIAKRAPMIASFDPISMLGRDCASAGVFTGIQELADLPFAPGTRIIDVMRGEDLDRFWKQLRWMTEYSIPPLSAFWCGVVDAACVLGLCAVIGGLIAAWNTSNPFWIVPTVLGALIVSVIAWVYKRFTNPLPPDLVTFRDLSIRIAQMRNTVIAR